MTNSKCCNAPLIQWFGRVTLNQKLGNPPLICMKCGKENELNAKT